MQEIIIGNLFYEEQEVSFELILQRIKDTLVGYSL